MGIKPDPGTFNNFCPLCFPLDETPESLLLFVSGIEKSPHFPAITEPAANGYADLLQLGPFCDWSGSGGLIWRGSLIWLVNESRVRIEARRDLFCFTQSVVDVCEVWFENTFQNPNVFAYNYGYAFICTPAQMAKWLELALPVTGPNPRMELFPMADRQIVIRFASIQDGTNLKLRFDVDDLP